ncbi:TPA: glycosyltransferase [Candidatus Bathyarchaeota archaeon]|nr:glycosyltransferase [Candidatus Bathyarchaeota archaeon]
MGNVAYLGLLPYAESLALIKGADIALVPLTANRYNDPALPSKVFDYCFAETPILASAGSSLKKFVEGNRIGFCVDPENVRRLAQKIGEMSKMPKEELKNMGRRGRRLVEKTYNRRVQAEKLEKILRELVGVD